MMNNLIDATFESLSEKDFITVESVKAAKHRRGQVETVAQVEKLFLSIGLTEGKLYLDKPMFKMVMQNNPNFLTMKSSSTAADIESPNPVMNNND